jgi:hypothetical protein
VAEEITHCREHPAERAETTCKRCRYGYCPNCLVFVHGYDKPPLCVGCALAQAGVRSGAKPAPRTNWLGEWRERRKGARRPVPVDPTPLPPEDKSWADLDTAWDA